MRDLNEPAQAAIWSEGEGPRPPAEPPGSAPASKPPARFQPINRQQMVLRAVDVEQLVGPDHMVRAIWEITGRLNLRSYTDPVRAVEGEAGRPRIDPRLLIALWIYAYSEKVSSAREVERRSTPSPTTPRILRGRCWHCSIPRI